MKDPDGYQIEIQGHLEQCPDELEPGQRASPGLEISASDRS